MHSPSPLLNMHLGVHPCKIYIQPPCKIYIHIHLRAPLSALFTEGVREWLGRRLIVQWTYQILGVLSVTLVLKPFFFIEHKCKHDYWCVSLDTSSSWRDKYLRTFKEKLGSGQLAAKECLI